MHSQAHTVIIRLSSKRILCHIYFLSIMPYFQHSYSYLCSFYTSCI